MNTRTKNALEDLCTAIDKLAYGVVLTIGSETVSEIMSATVNVRQALAEDKTITESH